MLAPMSNSMYVQCEIENLPKLIKGAQYIYIITTARDPDTSTGLYTGQAARALLVRYHKDGEGKWQVLRIGIHHGSDSEKPQLWRAILHLHTVLNMSVEAKRGNLDLKEGDAVE
ncbi:hypothetical protein HBI55_105310 [Parastagonospora nodorum]|nr:hypothetical protein HBI74_042440 [Parastagonospora nodorum]KAH6096812.1 hypothetical protein HBI65_095790 [Parastagonospora nodorum]KAH6495298.1 hypothetical protein HBI55_105310 [Parastagonospora nodorum]